jgi:hypothetical protein
MPVMEEVDPGKDIIKGIPKVPGLLWRVGRVAVPEITIPAAVLLHNDCLVAVGVVVGAIGLIQAIKETLGMFGASY